MNEPIKVLKEIENWDVLDENRQLTGRIHPRGTTMAKGEFHQVVHICIFHGGKLLVQQRQVWKRSWPGRWDISVAGCVLAGETSRQTAEREISEEIGISLSLAGKLPWMTMVYEDCFDDWWIVEQKEPLPPLHLQESEVMDARWVSPQELEALLDSGEMISHPPLRWILEEWKQGRNGNKSRF